VKVREKVMTTEGIERFSSRVMIEKKKTKNRKNSRRRKKQEGTQQKKRESSDEDGKPGLELGSLNQHEAGRRGQSADQNVIGHISKKESVVQKNSKNERGEGRKRGSPCVRRVQGTKQFKHCLAERPKNGRRRHERQKVTKRGDRNMKGPFDFEQVHESVHEPPFQVWQGRQLPGIGWKSRGKVVIRRTKKKKGGEGEEREIGKKNKRWERELIPGRLCWVKGGLTTIRNGRA